MSQSCYYSIVQFLPVPERLEATNVGVIIYDEQKGRIYSKTIVERRKLRSRYDEEFNWTFFELALSEFMDRIYFELQKAAWKESLDRFIATRANNFRVTSPLPVLATELGMEIELLFSELVAEQKRQDPKIRVRSRLRRRLDEAGVSPLLDRRPPAVEIERYGVVLKPEFGFRNGHYNLIDASRFSGGKEGVAEVGRRAIEGRSLADVTDYRLIVVGEFVKDDHSFFMAAKDDLARHEVQLFDIDDLNDLVKEIRLHS